MKRVYFDKGAFSQLWRCPTIDARSLERVRRRLSSPLFARRPQLVLGPATVSELAKAPVFQRDREIDYVARLPDVRYLAPVADRIQEEVRALSEGYEPEPFLGAVEASRILLEAKRDGELWRLERERLSADQLRFKEEDETARRATFDSAGSQQQLGAWMTDYLRMIAERVRIQVLELLRRHREEFGLPVDESGWPEPEQVRTAWAFIAYQVARFTLACRDGRRTDANDQADWEHYLGAAYADEFVVEDKKFRQVIEACPPPKPTVVSFDAWAAGMLA